MTSVNPPGDPEAKISFFSTPADIILYVKGYDRAVHIFWFADAPEEYRALSTNGGDEDWLAYVPQEIDLGKHPILEALTADSGTWFGWHSIDRYTLENGDSVFIGSHA